MIPSTNALLLCVLLLCGLAKTVLCQYGHCTEDQCFALFREPDDFPGAKKSCEDQNGQLFVYSLKDMTTILTILPSGLSGRYWLHSADRTTNEAEAEHQECPSISVSTERNFAMVRESCRENLDGFICQYACEESCSGLQPRGGAEMKYTAYDSFEVKDSDTFIRGTVAVEAKVGGEYPDSKHVCVTGNWVTAPWNCEVMGGGCEHNCSSALRACICPAGQTLHHNKISCIRDPCADCAQGCQMEGDTFVCKCSEGYILAQDRRNCEDVNECEQQNQCTGDKECVNTRGGFECRCKDGFKEEEGVCVNVAICEKCEHMKCAEFNGVYKCVCRERYRVSATDPTKCDMYCTERDCPAECNPNSENKNISQCFCPEGYIIDMTGSTPICSDINECDDKQQCDHTCEDLLGGYRCLCNKGFKLHKEHKCVPSEEEDVEDGSGSTPPYPTTASAHPAAVPSYIKTGSVLGITVFLVMCAALLFFLVRNAVKRCGKFEISTFKHPNIDIFYLQQVTTETYKRLSFDKQFKNDSQIL